MLIQTMSISLWKNSHLATTITGDHEHLCQCKSIFPYYRKPSTLKYKKDLFLKWQVTFGYIHPHSQTIIVIIIKGEIKAACASIITNSPPYTNSLILIRCTIFLVDQGIFMLWSYCWSSSQDGASTPGVFNLIWNSLRVCSSCFWFPAKYAAMALWNRTSWLCNTFTCGQG